MRPAPVKRFALTLALVGAVTVLTGRGPPEPDDAGSTDPPGAAAVSGQSSPAALVGLAKGLVARDVAAGRRSLLEAAGLFRTLYRLAPELPPPLGPGVEPPDWSRHLPAGTEEERLCLVVIGRVRWALGDPPDVARLEAVTARLEGEFWAARCEHGAIELPDVPPAAVESLLEQARVAERAAH
jgi:hypothetical protein